MKKIISIIFVCVILSACGETLIPETPESVARLLYRAIDHKDAQGFSQFIQKNTSEQIRNSLNTQMFALNQPFERCGGLNDVSVNFVNVDPVDPTRVNVVSSLSFKDKKCVSISDTIPMIKLADKWYIDFNRRSNTKRIGKY